MTASGSLFLVLKANAQLRDAVEVDRFEDALGGIASLHDPATIVPLLRLLDDGSELHEIMFAIVHTVEAFGDATYVRELLRALPSIAERAPYWTTVLHTRVLNSDSARRAYAAALRMADPGLRARATRLLRSIVARKPRFESA